MGNYKISYSFHAAQLDAGGSWIDPEQVYINFINICFAIYGRTDEKIKVNLDLPPNYKIACALPLEGKNTLVAINYQELVDSPVLAAESLHHKTYQVKQPISMFGSMEKSISIGTRF